LSRIRVHKQLVYLCLGLWALSIVLYARSASFEFVDFDDRTVLLAHPELYDETSFPASLSQILVKRFPREEPLLLRDITWALDSRLFGFENPFGYHLGNVILNGFNVVLLFLFLRRATRRPRLALVVAGLFAVLPVHVEPVCWVMGRKDVLVTFWMLLALLAQAHELKHPEVRTRRCLYLATLLFSALALLSKMSAVSLFLVLGLHRALHPFLDGGRDPRAPLDLGRVVRQVLPRTAPHLVLSLVVFLWFRGIIADYGVIGWRGPAPLDPGHLAHLAQFTPLVLALYVKQLLWPSQLSMFYRWPHVEIPLAPVELGASILSAVFLIAVTVTCCLRRKDLAFYLLSFLALLLPHLNIVYIGIWRADRYVYLASFCVLAMGAILASELAPRPSRYARPALIGLTIGFASLCVIQTVRQQSVWQNNHSLWQHEAQLKEPSVLALQALAKSYLKQAERQNDPEARASLLRLATQEIQRGIARDRELGRRPGRYRTSDQLHLSRLHYLLGRIAALKGQPIEKQLEHYSTAYQTAPDRLSAMMLAQGYFTLATTAPLDQQEPLIRKSFGFFLAYLRLSPADPVRHQQDLSMLEVNYQRFPFLSGEVQRARRTYFP
jgi:hypothetical protein